MVKPVEVGAGPAKRPAEYLFAAAINLTPAKTRPLLALGRPGVLADVRFAPKAALCGLESNFRFNSEIRLNSEIAPCRLLAPEAEATVSVRAKTLDYAAKPILTQNVPGYDPPSMRIF